MNVFVSHVNSHQKVISAEKKNIYSQVDRINFSVYITQTLSPTNLVIPQRNVVKVVSHGRGGGYATIGLITWPSTNQRHLATATAESPICKQ